jgi:hypothetical protein
MGRIPAELCRGIERGYRSENGPSVRIPAVEHCTAMYREATRWRFHLVVDLGTNGLFTNVPMKLAWAKNLKTPTFQIHSYLHVHANDFIWLYWFFYTEINTIGLLSLGLVGQNVTRHKWQNFTLLRSTCHCQSWSFPILEMFPNLEAIRCASDIGNVSASDINNYWKCPRLMDMHVVCFQKWIQNKI